ncbi:hypothetical protein Bca4012_018091 [Brassica carinata]
MQIKMGLRMSESAKPYFAMVCLQFGYAGMNLVTKTVLDRGMSHYVLIAYRNAFSTAAIAPFAFLSERKVRSKMMFPIFMHIFVLALLGPVIDQNLYYIGLKLTSPTFSSAISNIVLAITFILATLSRMEKVEMRKGVMSSSIAYNIQGLIMQRKGPVFVTAFNPLVVVIVSIMSFFVLEQGIYLGGLIGVVVMTVGVYAVLWGKRVDDVSEELHREDNTVLGAAKCCSSNYGLSVMPKIEEADEDVDTGKVQAAEKESSLVVVFFL